MWRRIPLIIVRLKSSSFGKLTFIRLNNFLRFFIPLPCFRANIKPVERLEKEKEKKKYPNRSFGLVKFHWKLRSTKWTRQKKRGGEKRKSGEKNLSPVVHFIRAILPILRAPGGKLCFATELLTFSEEPARNASYLGNNNADFSLSLSLSLFSLARYRDTARAAKKKKRGGKKVCSENFWKHFRRRELQLGETIYFKRYRLPLVLIENSFECSCQGRRPVRRISVIELFFFFNSRAQQFRNFTNEISSPGFRRRTNKQQLNKSDERLRARGRKRGVKNIQPLLRIDQSSS